MAAGLTASHTSPSRRASVMSTTSSCAASGTFSARPVDRSSTTTTSQLSARRYSAMCDPMNPAPPVTMATRRPRSNPARVVIHRSICATDAMILAAGLGTRLGALGTKVPKVLVDVGGRPLLERHLEHLESQGVERVVINVHHLAGQVMDFVDAYRGEVKVRCIYEPAPLGTAGAVRNALSLLSGEAFVVLYGDVVIRYDAFGRLLSRHHAAQADATLAVHMAPASVGKGTVDVDADGRITRFVEKAGPEGPAL